MDDRIRNEEGWDLKAMKAKIAEIEASVNELRDLGTGVPAVEKNTRNMLNCIYVLKFGIADIADMENH